MAAAGFYQLAADRTGIAAVRKREGTQKA